MTKQKLLKVIEALSKETSELFQSLKAQLAESQRREKAAVNDIYASANDPYHCGICSIKDSEKCEANADGSCPFEWRGPQNDGEESK